MRLRKLRKQLERRFGTEPDQYYFHGDIEYIRAYYDFRKETQRDDFLIDDITWNDLSMDNIFKRINSCLSTSGEQYLYYMLRSSSTEKAEYKNRKMLIDLMEKKDKLRLNLQVILSRLGRTRRADLSQAFHPSSHGISWLLIYLLLMLLMPIALILIIFLPQYGVLASLGVFALNSIVHELRIKKIERDFDTVNYTSSMIFSLHKIKKLKDPELDKHLTSAYISLNRLRSVIRLGGVSRTSSYDSVNFILTALLLDLISYEFLKNKLSRNHDDIFTVHESLGKVDAAISVASYRKSLEFYAEPDVDFSITHPSYINIQHMVHPLIESPIPNDLVTNTSVLITGSNASGKSTYLKVAALCAIMSQGICTCTAKKYNASAFRIFSSMALSDNILAGESYYIVETKSLKRILDSTAETIPVLCVIDEVLRGTNTVERIAASSEVLSALPQRGALCLAATHDIELCTLLNDSYKMYHFEETMGENEMLFDYKIQEGPAKSRNAINLLQIMGFSDSIVKNAHDRANRYIDDGIWS